MQRSGLVLLVEDDPALNAANRRALELRGYDVWTAATLEQARHQVARRQPDVILLDVMLPDGDGLTWCGQIRGVVDAHIIFLTARAEHSDVASGFRAGADDYLAKPFHPEELLLRVDAAMRRRRRTEPIVRAGPLVLDRTALRAFAHGRDLLLTPKQFALLNLLLERQGETLDKAFLYEQVWKRPLADDGNALWTQLSRLNHKLAGIGPGRLTVAAVRGEGYRLRFADPS